MPSLWPRPVALVTWCWPGPGYILILTQDGQTGFCWTWSQLEDFGSGSGPPSQGDRKHHWHWLLECTGWPQTQNMNVIAVLRDNWCRSVCLWPPLSFLGDLYGGDPSWSFWSQALTEPPSACDLPSRPASNDSCGSSQPTAVLSFIIYLNAHNSAQPLTWWGRGGGVDPCSHLTLT